MGLIDQQIFWRNLKRALAFPVKVIKTDASPIRVQTLPVGFFAPSIPSCNQAGVGDRPPTLVIGPIDRATVEASDALLKTLEDLAEGPLRVVLWADFLVSVSPTIRSRTQAIWCEGVTRIPKATKQAAESVVLAHRENKTVASKTHAALEEQDPEILLDAMIATLDVNDPNDLALWERLRPMLGSRWVTAKTAFIDAVVPT
jgi:hypothetical protein